VRFALADALDLWRVQGIDLATALAALLFQHAPEFLLLWSVASRDEKGSDLNVRDLSTGGKIRLMPDKRPTGFRIAGEQPPILPWDCGKSLSSEQPPGILLHTLPPSGAPETRSVTHRAVYSFLRSSCLTNAARRGGWELRVIRIFMLRLRLDISGVK
jgi:hypothetical protein